MDAAVVDAVVEIAGDGGSSGNMASGSMGVAGTLSPYSDPRLVSSTRSGLSRLSSSSFSEGLYGDGGGQGEGGADLSRT